MPGACDFSPRSIFTAAWNTSGYSLTTWTNTSATAGSFVFAAKNHNYIFAYNPFYFWGGPQNTVVFQGNYCYRIQKPVYGDWTLELDAAETAAFLDHRKRDDPSTSLQLCPAGGWQRNGKVSDGTAFTWGWTLRRN